MRIRKDHWYWVRYKYVATPTVGRPYSVREGRATGWCLPYLDRIATEKDDEIQVIAEIPFPDGTLPECTCGMEFWDVDPKCPRHS